MTKRPYRVGDGVGTKINWQITNGFRIFVGVYIQRVLRIPYVGFSWRLVRGEGELTVVEM